MFARTWRRNVFLASGNLLFAFCWALASFAIRWFQAGWIGFAFFSTVLIFAVVYVAFAQVIKKDRISKLFEGAAHSKLTEFPII